MSGLPLHLAFLQAVVRHIDKRQAELQAKTGKGLPDQEYQRHVGRIAELDHVRSAVQDLMKGGLAQVEDEEAELREQARQRRAQTRALRGH